MREEEHDKLAYRLATILIRLNNGEKLHAKELAMDFNVNVRTIQKDLNERLSLLPLENQNGVYWIDPSYLGKVTYNELWKFADFSKVRELYPQLDEKMFFDIFNEKVNTVLHIKGHTYENLQSKRDLFDKIGGAIKTSHIIRFTYKEKERTVQPYQLLNTNGIWYLAAVEDGILKHYSFSKISHFSVSEKTFTPDAQIVSILQDEKSKWYTQEQLEVKLLVDHTIMEYFLRRELLPHQEVEEETIDGFIISAKVAYEEEILRTVRYWIPHIKILSPDSLQNKLRAELENYLKN